MAEGRRFPSVGAIVAGACLLVPLAGVVWWLYRPKPDVTKNGPALSDLDVVAVGRIDGLAQLASLEPSVSGRVVKVRAMEGDTVKEGQELVLLDDSGYKLQEEQARAALLAADIELSSATLELDQHPSKVLAQAASLTAAATKLTAARQSLEERRKQLSFNTLTPGEFAVLEAQVKDLEQLEVLEQIRKSDLAAVEAGLKLRVKAAEAKKAAADVAVRTAEKAVQDCVLRAPSAGTVLRVQTGPGESVSPGYPRAPILFRPEGPLVVRVELEQEFLARVSTGAKATIRDETRTDSPTWTGRVLSVAKYVGPKRTIVLEPGVLNDVRTVECVITLDPPANGLLVGQRMRVQISRN
ncbi:MAG TPA: biotin/lipoyl-binding protein [Gemmataceae bacterium]|nr:biotin/lipoyl-binding protein [Gemmataceae bacterium]